MNHIPDGYNSAVIPYLTIKNSKEAIEFYKKAFGAEEVGRILMKDDSVGHAEIIIENARIMLGEECEEMGNLSPKSLKGTSVGICIYVKDSDSVFQKAISLGAKEIQPVADQFYGDRSGTVEDPFGHKWTICTHKEDLSFEEVQKRADALFG